MLLLDKTIWWQEANSVRIPLGIALAIAWGFRLRRIYVDVKNAPKRSPRVRRIEVIVATVLWTFIAVGVNSVTYFRKMTGLYCTGGFVCCGVLIRPVLSNPLPASMMRRTRSRRAGTNGA